MSIARDFYERVLGDAWWRAIMAKIDDPRNIDHNVPAAKKGSYHGLSHAMAVDVIAEGFLRKMEVDEETLYLAKIVALLHDVGISIDEENHEREGEVLAREYLDGSGLSEQQQMIILHAISDHRRGEEIGNLVDAAILLGDKLDVARSRLRPEVKNLDAVNMDVARILNVRLDVSADMLTVYYETEGGYVPKNLFALWPKAVGIPRKVAEFVGKDFEMFINGDLYGGVSEITGKKTK